MADVTPTAANVRIGAGSTVNVVTAGEILTQGQLVYLKSDGKYWKAIITDADTSNWSGIVVTPAAADAPVGIVPHGADVYMDHTSAIWTKGFTYIVSDTSGKMMDSADVTAGQFVDIVGVALSTTSLQLTKKTTGLIG